MHITINKKRQQTSQLSGYAGKHTPDAIQVDVATPSKFHRLKTDYQDFTGAEQWEADPTSKQKVITKAKELINNQIDVAILTGFTHNGYNFILTRDNQFNHKAEYDIRDQLAYPYKIKHAAGYLELQNADEYAAFYLAGVAHIRTQIVTGWARKDALQSMTTTEILELITQLENNQ